MTRDKMTEKTGIEIFKTHITGSLAEGIYTGTEQILKDLIQEIVIKVKEDLNPYSRRAQHVSWKADPECSAAGGSVTQPLYPGDGGEGCGVEKKRKKMTKCPCKHPLDALIVFIRGNIMEENISYWNIKWGCFMIESNALHTFFGDLKH